jgi:hypothetical protein
MPSAEELRALVHRVMNESGEDDLYARLRQALPEDVHVTGWYMDPTGEITVRVEWANPVPREYIHFHETRGDA